MAITTFSRIKFTYVLIVSVSFTILSSYHTELNAFAEY